MTIDDVVERSGVSRATIYRLFPGGREVLFEALRVRELDRFCDAMLAIREEIRDIEHGRIDAENNPLKNAPHTMEDLVRDWDRPYTREQGCFPPGAFRVDKYWPPVNRVDNAWGDRHLVCTCPPMTDYAEAAE